MTNNLNPTRITDNLDPVVEQSLKSFEVLTGEKPAEAELTGTSSEAEEAGNSTEKQPVSLKEVESDEPDSISFEDPRPHQEPIIVRKRRLGLWITIMILVISLAGTLVASSLTPDANIQEAIRFYEQGMASRVSGHISEAAISFESAVRLDPDFTTAHYNLGLVYHALGDRKGVLKQEKILRELDPILADKLYTLVFQ